MKTYKWFKVRCPFKEVFNISDGKLLVDVERNKWFTQHFTRPNSEVGWWDSLFHSKHWNSLSKPEVTARVCDCSMKGLLLVRRRHPPPHPATPIQWLRPHSHARVPHSHQALWIIYSQHSATLTIYQIDANGKSPLLWFLHVENSCAHGEEKVALSSCLGLASDQTQLSFFQVTSPLFSLGSLPNSSNLKLIGLVLLPYRFLCRRHPRANPVETRGYSTHAW